LATQLTLAGVAPHDQATFINFYPGKNQLLCQFLRNFSTGNSEHFAYLWGSTGSGRSHLLQACCHQASSHGASAVYLPLNQLPAYSLQEIVEGMENLYLVCIDDIDSIAGEVHAEEVLFDFYNRIRENQSRLLVSGTALPNDLNFALPDLSSRLSWGSSFYLHQLADEENLAALQARAKTRGFILPEDVGQFILRRCSRNTGDLFAVLDRLDSASLVLQRRLTIPFVKSVLGL
jgi:DnaA-homolog protein